MNFRRQELTSRYIQSKHKEAVQEFTSNSPEVRDEKTRIAIQEDEELIAIEEKSSSCPVKKLERYEKRLFDQDSTSTPVASSDKLMNMGVVQNISCLIDSVFHGIPVYQGYTEHSELLKDKIGDLRQIGEPSAYGVAMSGEVENVGFVVKVSKDPNDMELVHEAFIGLAPAKLPGERISQEDEAVGTALRMDQKEWYHGGLNYLRNIIPNFAFIHGAFYCSPPKIDPSTKKVIEYCTGEGAKIPYVIYEEISPSVSFREYVSKIADVEDVLSAYLQVVLATAMAYEYNDYTHYDLHTNNVLIRNITTEEEPFQIKYKLHNWTTNTGITKVKNGMSFYVMTRNVPTIIDYGMTHIKYREKDYGVQTTGLTPYWVTGKRSWPLHDCYKLLCFLARDAIEAENRRNAELTTKGWSDYPNRGEIINELSEMMGYFNSSENLYEIVKKQWEPYKYAIPPTQGYSIYGFIGHILTKCNYDGLYSSEKFTDQPILNCNGVTFSLEGCKMPQLLPVRRYNNFFSIYDDSLARPPYEKKSKEYGMARVHFSEKYNQLTSKLEADVTPNLIRVDLNRNNALNVSMMLTVRRQYNSLIDAVGILERLLMYSKVGNYAANLFGDELLRISIDDTDKRLFRYYGLLCEINKNAQDNYAIIHTVTREPVYASAVKNNSDLKWYKNMSGSILSLRGRECMRTFGN